MAASAVAGQEAPDLAAGQAAYQAHCARCHGDAGRGDGVDAKRFYPRPRDLSLGVYKFRSTASGTPPTDADLFQTITQGLPGSHMPDWPHLDEPTRWNLVAYLKSLSPVFTQTPPSPVAVSGDPGPSRADLAKGRTLYDELGCAACHGAMGRANGPSAGGLVDDWGMAIRPADLTQGWSFRGGHDPRAIMLRFLTGIDGAGMPSYADILQPEDAWQLAYYVASLQEPPRWTFIAHAAQAAGLPASLDDAAWAQAERADVRLRNAVTPAGEWAEPPTVRAVSVQAISTHEGIAFRFVWSDPVENREAPPDGFALLFQPTGAQGDVVTLQAWPYQGAPPLDLCYWSAQAGRSGEMLAGGFEPARSGNGALVPLKGEARYADGRWTLMVRRALTPEAPAGAAAVSPQGLTAIGMVVWDGSNPTTRAVSPWVDLRLNNEE